jgi:hypothetical protein
MSVSDWPSALPQIVGALLVLFLPGAALLLGAGAPWRRAVAFAPATSVGLVGFIGIAAGLAGLPFGVPVVVAATATGGVLLRLVLLVARRLGWGPPRRDRAERHRSPRDHAVLAGLALATVVLGARLLWALGGPDRISQTFDAVFHLNTTRYIVETGNGSSLSLLGWATGTGGFYPAAWHDLAALVAVDGDVVRATQALALVVAAVVWPLSMLLLVRRLLGQRWIVLLGTAALISGLGVFPARMLDFGVLYPFLLGIALMPALLAVVHLITGPPASRGDFRGLPLWVVAGAGAMGLALAHAGVLVAFGLLALVLVTRGAIRVGRRRWARGQRLSTALVAVAAVAILLGAAVVVDRSPMLAQLRTTDWPATGTPSQAFGAWLLVTPHQYTIPWVIAALTILGMGVALTTHGLRWLPVAHWLIAVPYIFAAGVDSPLSQRLTGFWYNDGVRLGALVPVTALPLAAVALAWLAVQVRRRGAPLARRISWAPLRRRLLPVAVVVATLGLVVVTTDGSTVEMNDHLATRYDVQTRAVSGTLLTSHEWDLLEELPRLLPAGARVAANPWDGSGLAYAVSGVQVLVPQLGARPTGPEKVVAERLTDAGRDPEVCRALDQLGIRYVLDFGPTMWIDERAAAYPGLEHLFGSRVVRLVASEGDAYLFEITACGTAR